MWFLQQGCSKYGLLLQKVCLIILVTRLVFIQVTQSVVYIFSQGNTILEYSFQKLLCLPVLVVIHLFLKGRHSCSLRNEISFYRLPFKLVIQI